MDYHIAKEIETKDLEELKTALDEAYKGADENEY